MSVILFSILLVAGFSLGGRGDGGGGPMGGFTFDTNLASMHTYLGGTIPCVMCRCASLIISRL
jgi:hypothetical protein